jgi:hypothetical protein
LVTVHLRLLSWSKLSVLWCDEQDGVWKTWELFSKISLTNFDTPGQFLTLGDKTALFLAVFLKKVRVY